MSCRSDEASPKTGSVLDEDLLASPPVKLEEETFRGLPTLSSEDHHERRAASGNDIVLDWNQCSLDRSVSDSKSLHCRHQSLSLI